METSVDNNENSLAPVGVFDSGIGGLTVAREIMRQLPNEKIVYFGDTARVPYGSKSKSNIIKYSRQIVRFLRTKGVKAIVVACNTASAMALDEIEKELDIPIIGVVKPGAKVAVEKTVNKRIGIIATEATISSGIYTDTINERDNDITVVTKACPLFVPLVEEGWIKDPITYEVARRYLAELQDKDIDTLVLGCTHYPLLRNTIGEIMGDKVTLVNPAYETAISLRTLLEEKNLAAGNEHRYTGGMYDFYVSDTADKFKNFANSILPFHIDNITQINIEEY
ncbi:MAG: glutamate racemase [Lachnospiraceae bacterium]|nr:glutamate racemase [Clostridiales bacterium]MDD6293099.1 glutamate racemase [Eubacteriales bacterium]MDY2606564.1 glutamate racemase [Lachnospiraceae bacterium]MDY6329026.1 glutamate racemase [Lachnospiraceae bacterium]